MRYYSASVADMSCNRLYHSSDDDGVLSDNFSDDDAQRNLSDMISTRERYVNRVGLLSLT